jgi:hypothetical protein
VAEGALTFSRLAESARPALVNGIPGIVGLLPGGQPFAVLGFAIRNGRIVQLDILTDPVRLRRIDLTGFTRPASKEPDGPPEPMR